MMTLIDVFKTIYRILRNLAKQLFKMDLPDIFGDDTTVDPAPEGEGDKGTADDTPAA